ncbi:MAG: winged helix-turn-helix transcriptional regulator [Marinicella sp.]
MYKFNEKEYPCSTTLTMGIIGGKWKAAILYNLISRTLRYNELRKQMPTVTERTLSLQLKTLEKDGIIKRKVYTSKPPLKVEYSLTELGKSLIPVLQALVDWAKYVVEHHVDQGK